MVRKSMVLEHPSKQLRCCLTVKRVQLTFVHNTEAFALTFVFSCFQKSGQRRRSPWFERAGISWRIQLLGRFDQIYVNQLPSLCSRVQSCSALEAPSVQHLARSSGREAESQESSCCAAKSLMGLGVSGCFQIYGNIQPQASALILSNAVSGFSDARGIKMPG